MYIEVIMFDVKTVDEGEEEGIGDNNISSVVDEGVRRSTGALVVNTTPGRSHGSKVSPPVVWIQ